MVKDADTHALAIYIEHGGCEVQSAWVCFKRAIERIVAISTDYLYLDGDGNIIVMSNEFHSEAQLNSMCVESALTHRK